LKNKDWLFIEGNKIFNFRTNGILVHNGKVLIQRSNEDVEYAVPGGQVAWGETSAEALVREFKEEMGADISADRLIWVEESFWKWGNKDAHSICHYYLVSLKDPSQIPEKGTFTSLDTDASRLIFQWIDIKQLKKSPDITVYPLYLKDKITGISDGIEHFIYHESNI
jgi:ADP-ribose pyrophosphatase YjhB (NUDIX family)